MPRNEIQNTIDLGINRKLIEINDSHVKYLVQDNEYPKDPEELVRASTYIKLVEQYHYSPNRISFEVQVPRRTPSDFADIVVFEDDDKTSNYIVVENKAPNCSDSDFAQAVEQGFGNANSLRAKYVVIDSHSNRQVFDVANYPPNERHTNKIIDIPDNYGLVVAYRIFRGGTYDIQRVSFSELSSVFQKCHNVLWSGGKLDPAMAFDEMSKILFAKIQDERATPNNQPYKMQIGQNENEVIVAQRCISLYDEARRVDPYVFTETINVTYQKVASVVDILQGINLSETDLDAKGQAFEKFLGVIFRGGLGQYFTRRQIVEFVVNMLAPDERDVVLDPSCGSGGFLLYSVKRVADTIKRAYAGNDRLIDRKIYDFSRNNVYGIEINDKIARVAMMDMIVNDDGHTNIENNTGLNSNFRNPNIEFNMFSLIMTNPPFGVNIKKDDRDNLGQNSFSNFEFGKTRKTQVSDILFLEQYKRFLASDENRNPRAGIVLSNGVLNNPTNKKLLEWLRLNFQILAVVSLPVYTFRKAGSGMKTCLLFVKKYPRPYQNVSDIPDYEIFLAIAKHIGYDSTLRPDTNDLPSLNNHYINHTEARPDGIFWMSLSSLEYRLDPTYYNNKFIIATHFERLRSQGHKLVPLHDLLAKMNAGKSPEGGVTRSTGEIPSITITNMTKDGTLDFSEDINFVPDEFYDDFNRIKGKLELLDILIAKDGATTGKTTIIDEHFPFLENAQGQSVPKAIFSEHIFRLRMKTGISPNYINAFLNSELGQLQLETVITGGAQGGITKDFVKDIYVPVVIEQEDIAQEWVDGMRQANEFKNQYENSIKGVKESIDEAISHATPISEEQLQQITTVIGDIEENEE